MPFKSAAQRAWMYIHKPDLARKWSRKYGSKVGGGKTKAEKAKSRK